MSPEVAFPHPRFSYNTNSHDIALIGLPESVLYSSYVRPACLPHAIRNMPLQGQKCTVIGWGKTTVTADSNQLSDILRKVDLNVEKDEVCHNMYLIYKSSILYKLD